MLTQKDLDSLDEVLEAYRRCRSQLEGVGHPEARPNRELAAAQLTEMWLRFARSVEENN
jgi:hypothetical protein